MVQIATFYFPFLFSVPQRVSSERSEEEKENKYQNLMKKI
jgi:hypothetical protein